MDEPVVYNCIPGAALLDSIILTRLGYLVPALKACQIKLEDFYRKASSGQ